ncbi:hypothetical protein AYK25_01665 [Thermoplasmatales archaeon SM1-50]|nr:MAG: hypothetical protein AYK25_01665 [Thermoplasmatales archaeon SM1-50]
MRNIIGRGVIFGIVFLFIGICIPPNFSITLEDIDHLPVIIDDEFDSKIAELMKKGHMPSLVACIIKDNTTVWSKAYGYLDYYKRINATIDTVYPIASVTKSVTATAIMQIIENESYNVDLDDNVSEYLPFDLKNPRYPNVNISFRILLAHQSSLGDSTIRFILLFTLLKIPFNLITFQHYLVKGGVLYHPKVWNDYRPGEGVCYTTQGIDILGLLIEQITNQSYSDYCQNHIFKPLKMFNTSFYFSDITRAQLVCLYIWMAGFYLKQPYIQTSNLAGGGLKTTLSDFSHFLIMHTSGGMYDGVRILSEESVEEMHRAQYPGYYDGGFLYGLGWYQRTIENETYGGHAGNWRGARAQMKMRYSDKVGILFFWNQNSFLKMHLNQTRPEEREAVKNIEKALFEKSDEFQLTSCIETDNFP